MLLKLVRASEHFVISLKYVHPTSRSWRRDWKATVGLTSYDCPVLRPCQRCPPQVGYHTGIAACHHEAI